MSNYPQALIDSSNAWLFKPIYNKIHSQHQHFSLVICGAPGSGKSYCSLSIAEMLYKDFDPETSVVFSAEQFTNLTRQKLPKGFPIIIDDSGLTAASQDAATREVKVISKILQSIRHRNLIIILNLPNFFLLAKNVRTLLDYYAEPVKINKADKITHAKFRILKVNPTTGQIYKYSPIMKEKVEHWTGYIQWNRTKIITIPIPKPSESVCSRYENLKDIKMRQFNIDANDSLKKKDKASERREKIEKVVEGLSKNLNEYSIDGEIIVSKICADFEVSKPMVKEALDIIRLQENRKEKQLVVDKENAVKAKELEERTKIDDEFADKAIEAIKSLG